jgi:hypothetical protein
MPYTYDRDFPTGLNDDDKVWRYVNFTKYVDLLERKKQYFVSGYKLMEIDPYEGYFQKSSFLYPERIDEFSKKLFEQKYIHDINETPKFVFVNCWHVNEIESNAMWKMYATLNAGIAIQTTYKKLQKSFHEHHQNVTIRKVRYVDNKKKDITVSWIPHRFSMKGESFSCENELRIFVEGIDNTTRCIASEDGTYYGCDIIPQDERIPIDRDDNGIYVKVDLNDFIEKIYVSPLSEKWFSDLVKTVTKKYGLNQIVEKSDLLDKPSI